MTKEKKSSNYAFLLDVDIVIPKHGITAIIGASGSGKTTLLRCIAGLEEAPNGHLIVNGELWQSAQHFLPTHKRSVGYVFQEASLFPHLTAAQNIDYAVRRCKDKRAPTNFQQIVEILGIADILSRYPEQLSGGERQRVAIARALMSRPSILLMDEPLASLDYARKQEVLPYLEQLHQNIAVPIIYVSHAMDEVTRLADHAIVIENGKVVTQGNLTEVFSRIDISLSSGQDIGVIVQGVVAERDHQWHLSRIALPHGDLWLTDTGDEITQNVRVRILARDISIALSEHVDASILNRLPVTVAEIGNDVDDAMVLVRLLLGDTYLVARITRRSLHHLNLSVGKSVWAQIKSAAVVR